MSKVALMRAESKKSSVTKKNSATAADGKPYNTHMRANMVYYVTQKDVKFHKVAQKFIKGVDKRTFCI